MVGGPPALAILIALVVGTLAGTWRSGISQPKSELIFTKTLLDKFELECGRCPTAAEGLNALHKAPRALASKWRGQYGEKPIGNDQWDNPYRYRSPSPQMV